MALPKIRDRGLQALLLVTAFSAVICAIIWGNFLLPRGQMMWDEAEHVFTGLIFANDMLRLDFPSLAGHAYGQVLWPPLHPLLLSGFFLLFGQGVEAARASSLALYFLFVIAMFFLGKEMASRNKDVSGILCSAFALVTGSLYLSASEAMLEMLALLFFTLSLLSFLRFQKDARMWQAVPVFTLLAFFSKTNFGIALILAYLAHFLIKERLHLERLPRNGDFLRIFLPVLLIILVWMMPPDRLQVFLGSLVNRPEGPPALSAEGLLYYPTQIFIYSGPLLLLYAAALALSFKHLKNEKFRFLVIVALLAILLNLFHQNRKIRYILYLYPPLFSLAAFHLTNLYSRIKQRKKHLLFCLAIAASMAVYAIHLHSSIMLNGYGFSVTEPLDFMKSSTQDSGSIFVLGEFNEISPGLISWHLSSTSSIKDVEASSYAAWEFAPGLFQGLRLTEKAPDKEAMDRFLENRAFDAVVLIEVENGSVFYSTEDYLRYNRWKLDYIPIVMENGNYTVCDRRLFQDIGVEIAVLKKIST